MHCHSPHGDIARIFRDLFPAHGMTERPEQTALAHRLLDAMLNNEIALCDAGTGIGKTYAVLAAVAVFSEFCRTDGRPFQPIVVSTSGIDTNIDNKRLAFFQPIRIKGTQVFCLRYSNLTRV